MKDTFSINDVAMITSLSTRTIRTYITTGFLSGEKIDGAWVFTPEQVQAFIENKAVRPSIKAKKNAIVFDFLGAKPYSQDKMCVILDLGSKEALSASVFFCEKISACSPEAELHFASDPVGTGVRLILSGSPKDVMHLMNQFYEKQ
ncbi:MAG: hypothetical protein IKH30_17530 [Clostridia bacterium]|nr:hypothetical protein [Clostridia bacterium]